MTKIQPVNKYFYLFKELFRHRHPDIRSDTNYFIRYQNFEFKFKFRWILKKFLTKFGHISF